MLRGIPLQWQANLGAPVIASRALTVDAHAVGVRALLAGSRLWNGHPDEIAILPGGRNGDIGCVR